MANKKQVTDNVGAETVVIDGNKFLSALSATELRITSATRAKGACAYSYSQRSIKGFSDSINVNRDALMNPDLINSFDAFNPHLACICEEVGDNEIMSIEEAQCKTKAATEKLLAFVVSSVSFSGNLEDGTIVLKGTKALSTGEVVKLETPKIRWSDKYSFLQELSVAAQSLVYEVTEYHNGKIADDPQGDLFGEQE
jgi:hypothetical protein